MSRRLRIIDQLRRKFHGRWRYDGWGRWIGPAFAVQCYASVSSSSWLGDGDVVTATYHRTDTDEQVLPSKTKRTL